MPMGNARLTKPRSVGHHSLSNIRPLQYRPSFYGFLILRRGKKALPVFAACPKARQRRSRFAQKLNIPKKFLEIGSTRKAYPSARIYCTDEQPTRSVICTSSSPRSQVFQRAASTAAPMLKHACDCVITPGRRQLPTEHDSYSLLQPEASCPC
jgi:hypothetical protein